MSTATTTKRSATDLGREGVYFDKRAGQYCSRLGFWLNAKGERARALQYLGSDPEAATVKHVGIVAEWKRTKENWAAYRDVIRPGLPEAIRDVADLALPVWIKAEWLKDAETNSLHALVNKITVDAEHTVTQVEAGKKFLKGMIETKIDWLAFVPDEIRSRVLHAIQPPAHEVMGFTKDAQRPTVEQAKAMYLADLKSRVDLPEDGIKPATYHNSERMLRLALALKSDDADEAPVIPLTTQLDELSRDELVAFKRAWLRKVSAGDVTKRTAANYCKSLQYFLAWVYKRERIISRRVPDLEDVFRFEDVNPINIEDYGHAKDRINAILSAATDRVRLYCYLALNCGYYQADIGRLKLSEIQQVGSRLAGGEVDTGLADARSGGQSLFDPAGARCATHAADW
jgi:hypothetical protein